MCPFFLAIFAIFWYIFVKKEVISMGSDYYDINGEEQTEKTVAYHVRIRRRWFRHKEIFTEEMADYERRLTRLEEIHPVLNAGNMIYLMMRKLKVGVDWDKQDALIASYRDLMYKLSYVDVVCYQPDVLYLHILGQKVDVMWTLTFLSQVYPDEKLSCTMIPADENEEEISFDIQNGMYVGVNAAKAQLANDALPNIWAMDMRTNAHVSEEQGVWLEYSPDIEPIQGESFALPDGRLGVYMRMDERYLCAEKYRENITITERHNISASIMKDFADLVRHQVVMDYTVYQMRYVAFMNKVHDLEHKIKGFEISVYDMLPIGERGLPFAEKDTIKRTNWSDCDSLKYIIDKVKRGKNRFSKKELKSIVKEATQTIVVRLRGYDLEYQMYQSTGTPEDLCRVIHIQICCELYADVAELESLGVLYLPEIVYRTLCNESTNNVFSMTDFEKQKRRMFGQGYLDFLLYQLDTIQNSSLRRMYTKAYDRLRIQYLSKK